MSRKQSYSAIVGKPVGILTTTMFYTGTLVRVEPDAFVLTEADWVGETGAWADFASNLGASEAAPFPPATEVYVSRAQCVIIFGADPALVRANKLTKRLTPKS
jgi:hypothetical protein